MAGRSELGLEACPVLKSEGFIVRGSNPLKGIGAGGQVGTRDVGSIPAGGIDPAACSGTIEYPQPRNREKAIIQIFQWSALKGGWG